MPEEYHNSLSHPLYGMHRFSGWLPQDLSGNVSFSDIDGYMEINDRSLYLELKSPYEAKQWWDGKRHHDGQFRCLRSIATFHLHSTVLVIGDPYSKVVFGHNGADTRADGGKEALVFQILPRGNGLTLLDGVRTIADLGEWVRAWVQTSRDAPRLELPNPTPAPILWEDLLSSL